MLRLFVLLLVLANGVYFAWSEGLLRAAGYGPAQQQEPQRLVQQIKPEAVRLLTSQEFKKAQTQAQADLAPKECLQAGPFDDEQTTVLRRALEASLAPDTWQLETVVIPARWIVYMGKFASADGLAKKRDELAVMHLVPQIVNSPGLEMGLSLGAFDSQAGATAELAKLNLRGIRTARVVQDQAQLQQTVLKFAAVGPELKSKLNDITPALAGKPLKTCP
jgi:hypothetical protein